MRGKRYGWVLAAALFLSGAARAQDVAGLVNECEACHGPGGVSTEADVPSLAGRGTTYIREKLDQFHNYQRHCSTTTYRHSDRPKTPTSMCNVANSLSEEDKQAVAEYFARQ